MMNSEKFKYLFRNRISLGHLLKGKQLERGGRGEEIGGDYINPVSFSFCHTQQKHISGILKETGGPFISSWEWYLCKGLGLVLCCLIKKVTLICSFFRRQFACTALFYYKLVTKNADTKHFLFRRQFGSPKRARKTLADFCIK